MTLFDNKNLSKELVIARYNENLDWITELDCFDKITIYNKGEDNINLSFIKLPNINNEAHTYFYHIVNNYNNLSDITVFCQGNPFDHTVGCMYDKKTRQENEIITTKNFNEKIKLIKIPETGFIPLLHYFDLNEFTAGYPIISTQTYSNLFEGTNSEPLILNGAQFVVLKENILSKSYKFYSKNLEHLQTKKTTWNDTIFNPWSYESMWFYIFDKNVKENIEHE